eukprot:scpid105864/ scgid23692/ 
MMQADSLRQEVQYLSINAETGFPVLMECTEQLVGHTSTDENSLMCGSGAWPYAFFGWMKSKKALLSCSRAVSLLWCTEKIVLGQGLDRRKPRSELGEARQPSHTAEFEQYEQRPCDHAQQSDHLAVISK